MLDISPVEWELLSAGPPRELSSAHPDEAPVASQWEVRLLQVLSAGPATSRKLLQGFVAVDEVTIRGNSKLHVFIALVSQLLIVIFKYLTGSFSR
jgi:hypothetical protein